MALNVSPRCTVCVRAPRGAVDGGGLARPLDQVHQSRAVADLLRDGAKCLLLGGGATPLALASAEVLNLGRPSQEGDELLHVCPSGRRTMRVVFFRRWRELRPVLCQGSQFSIIPGRSELIAKEKTKKQSAMEKTTLDNHFHRTDLLLQPPSGRMMARA